MSSSARLAIRIRSASSHRLNNIKSSTCADTNGPSGAQPRKRRFSDIVTGFRMGTPAVSFTPTFPPQKPEKYQDKDYKPNDERTLKLGKSKPSCACTFIRIQALESSGSESQVTNSKSSALRTLQPLLPTLLQSPLPSSILSPQISLHLFPSTHPHLPVVHGRVAYMAALWTSPLAWGRVPLVGNVKLEILSERMVRSPTDLPPESESESDALDHEQLVVRWRTVGKPSGSSLISSAAKLAGRKQENGQIVETMGEDKEFTGLFIFAFDEEGRICRHVIEHVQEHGNWERGVGARVVGLTDWLLGRVNKAPEPNVGTCCVRT